PVGLVTSSPRWYVEQILDDVLPSVEFSVTVTYNDVAELKPHPEPLLCALERADARPADAIYVGDSDLDYRACRSAGIDFVGAGWASEQSYPSHATVARAP